jgi:hypothetical protein
MQINRDNLKWAGILAALLLLVGCAYGLSALPTDRLFAWYLIPALLPALICIFVVIPLVRAEQRKGKNSN